MGIKDEIINRIKREYTVASICADLNITLEELYNYVVELRQKDKRYFYAKVCSNAEMMLSSHKQPENETIKITIPNGEFSWVNISDSHVGNIYDQLDRFRSLEDFMYNENIIMLVNNGDSVDGPEHEDQSIERRIPNLDDQLVEFIENYPYIDGFNAVKIGDHDNRDKTSDGYNFQSAIKEYRPDIKIYGNATGVFQVNNKEIMLCHDMKDKNISKAELLDDRIITYGHSHIYYNHSTYANGKPVIRIVVPSISNLPLHNGTTPGFLKFTVTCSSNQIVGMVIDNYTFEGKGSHILHNGSVDYRFPFENIKKEESNGKSRKRK